MAPPKDSGLLGTSESSELRIIDAITGTTLNTVRPNPGPGETVVRGIMDTPSLADVGGSTLVLVMFVLDVPGHGTTRGKRIIELTAVDTLTNRTAWTLRFADLPDWGKSGNPPRAVSLIGVQDGIAVVVAEDGYGTPTTYAVDLVARRPLWHRGNDFHPFMTGTGVVVGTDEGIEPAVSALSLANGTRAWIKYRNEYDPAVAYFAPDRLSVSDSGLSGGEGFFHILNATTGVVLKKLPAGWGSCRYDDRSATICTSIDNDDYLISFDAKTANDLWWLSTTKGSRIPPTVTAVWHGAVYGRTANGPVIVDARTGHDRSTALTIVPDMVDAYVGIVNDKDTGEGMAYPSIG
ncbi:PQQ-like beta-propeller repeat protein [Streptomyces sp. NBC_00433]